MIPLFFLLSVACFPSANASTSGSVYLKPFADSANTYARLCDEVYVKWYEPTKADLGVKH